MSSLEVMHQHNGGLESLDSEYSIIADQPLVNGSVSESVTSNGHFDLHLALTSATPDMSLEELQNRLAEVVEDNVSLREALRRNNDLMQTQLTSISSWHGQLTTTMSKQQLDLREAEDKIKALEKENKELQDKMKEVEEKRNRAIRDSISPFSDEEVDFEIINRKEFKKMVDASKLKEAEDKISNLIKVIEDQNKEIEVLKKNSIENEVSHAAFKESLQCQTSNESVQQLEKRVKDLEQSLAVESAKLEEEKACHSETKKMFAMVQTNYDRVTKLLQIQSRDERDKKSQTADDLEHELDTKMYLEQIDQLTAKLLDAEQKLQEEGERVKALTTEVNILKEDSETIPILKAQADVYKMDLETATLARDAAKEEVNRLTQQLHDVGSASCDSCHGSMTAGASHLKGKKKPWTHKKLELKQKDELYCCPVCFKGFTGIRAAESHANECIDQSEKSH